MLLEPLRVLDGIFVYRSYVAIHDTRAELCSGDVGFAQAEMSGFLCVAGALDRGQLSGKKSQQAYTSICLIQTLQSARRASSSNSADIPERLSGGER